MGRHIGKRVIEACAILDNLGPSTVRDVSEHSDAGFCDVHKYCTRAVLYGLAEVDKQRIPYIFKARDGWQDLLADKGVTEFKPRTLRTPSVNSVWNLGARPSRVD